MAVFDGGYIGLACEGDIVVCSVTKVCPEGTVCVCDVTTTGAEKVLQIRIFWNSDQHQLNVSFFSRKGLWLIK